MPDLLDSLPQWTADPVANLPKWEEPKASWDERVQSSQKWAWDRRASEPELLGTSVRDVLESSIPFASALVRRNQAAEYGEAKKAFDNRTATDAQLGIVAEYELGQQRQANKTIPQKIAGAVAFAPSVIGEAVVGGQAVGAAGRALGLGRVAAAAPAPIAKLAASPTAQSVATQAAATPLTPSVWLAESQERANKNGGNWYDPKNVAPPLLKGAIQNAIMGHAAKLGEGKSLLGRAGIGAAVMPTEQAAADVLVTLGDEAMKKAGIDEKWQTETKYGTIGQFYRGESGDAWAGLASQALIGAGFAAASGRKVGQVESLQKAADHLAAKGADADLAARILQESLTRPPEEIRDSVIRDFADLVRSPETAPEPATAPESAKQALPDEQPAQTVPAAPEPEIAPPPAAPEARRPSDTPPPMRKLSALEELMATPGLDLPGTRDRVEYRPPPPSERMVNESDAPAAPPAKAKGLGRVKKAAEPALPPEPKRVSEDTLRPNADLEDFFAAPAKPPEPAKAPADLRANALLDEIFAAPVDERLAPKRFDPELFRAQQEATNAAAKPPDRRKDAVRRKTVAEMTPEERARELLTSQVVDLPNRRAFEEAGPAKTVAMSDADALKAFNDTYGYEAGDQLLKAKANALKMAGLDAYHEKGDEFLYRADSPADLRAKMDAAREILRASDIVVTMKDGTTRTFRGADFSYGVGDELKQAEAGLKTHKAEREARGERARGELRGIVEVGPGPGGERPGDAAKPQEAPAPSPAAGREVAAKEPAPRGEQSGPDAVARDEAGKPVGVLGKLSAVADGLEASAKEQIAEMKGRLNTASPEMLVPYVKLAAAKILRGGVTLAEFTQALVQRFGESIRPRAADIWKQAEAEAARLKATAPDAGKEFALANAKVDEFRVKNGLPPLMEAARIPNQDAWDRALARLSTDPGAANRLVDELARKHRPTDVDENAILLHHQVTLKTAFARVQRKANAELLANRVSEFQRFDAEAQELKAAFDRVDGVTKRIGTDAGRSLQFRRQLARDDYTLGGLMNAAIRAKKSPLDAAETRKVVELADRIERAQDRIDFLEKQPALPEANPPAPGIVARVKEWLGSLFAGPKKAKLGEPATKSRAWQWADKLETDSAKEIARKFGPDKLFSGFDPEAIPLLAKYTAAKIVKTGLTFGDFAQRITSKFGDDVKPFVQQIWERAKKETDVSKMDLTGAKVELNRAKNEAKSMQDGFGRRLRSAGRVAVETAMEANNAFRAFITAYDLSAPFRQGAMLTLGNPARAAKASVAMLKAAASERFYDRAQQEIKDRPNAQNGLYDAAGLYLSDHYQPVNAQEEAFLGRWVQKIPGVAASERGFTMFLNRMRADTFDAMAGTMARNGQPDLREAAAIADYVNKASGRGTLPGRLDDSAATLAQVFFSPRYLASRFQILAGQPLVTAPPRARGLIAKEYGKALLGLAAFYAAAKAFFGDRAEIGTDPRSADFGKVKVGETRMDPLAGLSQITVLGGRLATGESVRPDKTVVPLRGPGARPGNDTGTTAVRFVRNKLAPAAGVASDFVFPQYAPQPKKTLKDVVGDGIALKVAGGVVPIAPQEVIDIMKSNGMTEGAILSLFAMLGMGAQVYDRR